MGYTLLQIGDILLKADRTMYKIGSIAYDDMFNALDEALDYNRDIIYIYKKAVEYADDFYVGTDKLDTVVEKLGQKVAAYDFGKLTPIYSDATIVTGVVPFGAALNDLSDVTITNVQDNQILRYNSALGQWINVGSGAAVRNRQQFTATLNQTVFVTSFPFSSALLDVYLNGVKLSPPSYTTFGNYTITLADGSIADDIVEVIAYDGDTSFIDLSGYVQISRTLTINGVTYDLSDNRSWTVTGGVPYTGATGNVNLGEFELKAGQLTLDTTPTGTAVVGTTRWNDTIGSSETTLKGGSVILKNGVDLVARVVNKVTPNTTLTKANYQAVRVSGAQGQRLAVAFAQANNDANSADTIGLVCETIATNQEGFIMTMGQLENINTTGSLQGETWADGDVLYLSPTTPGAITKVKPTGAGHIVVIGYVEYAHVNNGKIYVKVMNGWELEELHNVDIVSPANNEALIYESSTALWKNKTIATALGYTPISGSGVTGQVAYWNGTNSQTGSNNLFWNNTNGRLGIGTNNPLATYTQSQAQGIFARYEIRDANANLNIASWDVYTNTLVTPDFFGKTAYKFEGGINNASKQFQIYVGDVNTPHLALNGSGSLMLGGVVSSGQRLQVYGDAFIKGSGATSATNALLVQNTNGTLLFSTDNGGTTTVQGITNNDTSVLFRVRQQNTNTRFSVNALGQTFIGGDANAATDTLLRIERNFNPTSGTATHVTTLIIPTINQTGGANGITRGLYVNPTLTAAADWRSIEWSNNSGWGLYGSGTAPNFLGGSLGIGSTALTGVNLYITKPLTESTSFSLYNFPQINSTVSVAFVFRTRPQTQAASFTLGNLIHYGISIAPLGAGSSIFNQYGFIGGSDMTTATNNYVFYGDLANGTNRWNLYMSGTADNYLRGKLLINTTSVDTFALDVNGTARVSGDMTIQKATPLLLFQSTDTSIFHGIEFRNATTLDATIKHLAGTSEFRISNGRSAGWGGFTTFYTDTTERLRIKSNGSVRYQPMATPGTAEAGDVYYDSTSNKLRCYNGTTWNDLF